MHLVGNEKKIQALFLELKLEDERTAPVFARVWNRAQFTKRTRGRVFKVFGLATVTMVMAMSSLLFWWGNRDRGQQSHLITAGQPKRSQSNTVPSTPAPKVQDVSGVEGRQEPNREKPARLARRYAARQSEMNAFKEDEIRNAVGISTWQSPTAGLMQSPAHDVLITLPPVDQHATELKSFLPSRSK